MTLDKIAIPLTITASVIAIAVFLRGSKTTLVTGALPAPMQVPSYANVPSISYNVATPTPPPVQGTNQAVPFVPYIPGSGLITNNWYGAVANASDSPSQGGIGDCGCGCDASSKNGNGNVTPYFQTVSRSLDIPHMYLHTGPPNRSAVL